MEIQTAEKEKIDFYTEKEAGEGRVSAKKRETVRKELRKSMLENLEARGLVELAYIDMLEQYMKLWDWARELEDDVRERGVTVYDNRGHLTENRSISLGIQVSKQMLSIYTALGFKEAASAALAGGGEDDEL